jgi:hypothetical protein
VWDRKVCEGLGEAVQEAGIDMSREMVQVARKGSKGMGNAEGAGNLEFVLADAMTWESQGRI